MNEIVELTKINFSYLFIVVFVILIGVKMIVSLFEWVIDKLGLETKWMRKKREEYELLIQTSQNLTALQEQYNHDIVEYNSNKDQQINNLMVAQREILADKINEKYKYYISIMGIPEDEVDEFTNLHKAYKGVGGNHSGDAKYEYCMDRLPVIPVETKLIMKTTKEIYTK